MATKTPDLLPEGWDHVATWYERIIAPNTARYAADTLRAMELDAGARVLDVAAGTGAFTFLAAKAGARVLATDFAPLMIDRLRDRLARERVAGVDAAVMDGQKLDLPDASFDAAASVFGLIFFPDRVQGLREMHRVLKPGGVVGLATWSVPPKVRVISIVGDAVREALPELPPPAAPPAIFSMSDTKRVESEMREAGFDDVRIQTVTYTWSMPTPESVWTELAPVSPVFAALLAALTPAQRDRVRDVLVAKCRKDFGEGPVLMPSEAHIAVGRRG